MVGSPVGARSRCGREERSAMPARTTMPKVVNCRKAKTAPMMSAAKAKYTIRQSG